MNEPKYTPNDLNKAMGSLLIVLGAHLPENLVKSMADMLSELSGQIGQSGEPSVARLTAGFAEALKSGTDAKKSRQHCRTSRDTPRTAIQDRQRRTACRPPNRLNTCRYSYQAASCCG